MNTSPSSDSLRSFGFFAEQPFIPQLRLAVAGRLRRSLAGQGQGKGGASSKRVMLFLLAMLAGCTQVMDVKVGAPLTPGARWVLLPFSDYGETPQAGERAEELASSLMRVRWNLDLVRYPPTKESLALVDLDERQRYESALTWARDQGFMYGLAGSVQEWRYRSGAEGEAAVGLSLRVINIKTGRPEWLATASRSGIGAQTVSGIAERLVRKMVNQIQLK